MATKTKSTAQEGDYVPGLGILTPTGTYKPTAAESTVGKVGYGYWDTKGWVPNKAPTGNNASSSEVLTTDQKNAIAPRNDITVALQGGYGNQAAEQVASEYSPNFEKTISKNEAVGIAKNYGLTGMNDADFTGLTRTQAEVKARQLQKDKMGQTSELTSYQYNPETISGFKNKINDLKLKLDQNNNDPWSTRTKKKENSSAILKSFTDQFAGIFNNQDELNAAMQNGDFQKYLKQYEQAGGSLADIQAKVGQNSNPQPVVSQNQTTSTPAQTVNDYLGNLNTPAAKSAMNTLMPENKIAQDKIALEQSIPEQYKKLYFGDEQSIGLVQQQKQQADEQIKILERKKQLDEKNLKAQADYAIEQNNFETQKSAAETEENRLNAKNYLTGMLAKMGALNTSTAAPIAIANLDQKYQTAITNLKTSNDLSNKQISLKLTETIDNIGVDLSNDVLKVKQNLSKSEEDIYKEIFKLQTEADKKTLDIINSFAKDFRTQKDKFEKASKAEAKKYVDTFANVVGNGLNFTDFMNQNRKPNTKYNYAENVKSNLPGFLSQVIGSQDVSSITQTVLQGKKKLADYSAANQAKINAELKKLGITSDVLSQIKPETTTSTSPKGRSI